MIYLLISALGLQTEALAAATLKLYYEEKAQVELISPFIVDMAGLRIAHFSDIGQEVLTHEQLKVLGKVDIAITQLSNMWSGMSAENKK